MSHALCNLLITTVLLVMAIPKSIARPGSVSIPVRSNLVARLKLDDESSNCWDSLIQLQSCSGEVILFFLNGETYLGPSCCQAIRIIGQHCWPAMFGTIGFTTEETDVLQGYCDEEAAHSSPPTLPQPPSSPSVQPTEVVSSYVNLVP
ncbi:Prolamin-like domain containing protein [Parasponia andersonii]|uniref:Prolamin-like domain containing protein n=1 Tax=Parasponia andersonii TaxID=3476 RepID=A0A2P5BJI7_PARAD|nr:Prolamin-like domain containing protein [Parasponia andersonii]